MPLKDPEARKIYKAKWHKANRIRLNVKRKQRYIEGDRFRIYGITAEQFSAMFILQEGKCGICKKDLAYTGRDTCIDHEHETGKFRGILCKSCNMGLGHFEDNISGLEAALAYLKERS